MTTYYPRPFVSLFPSLTLDLSTQDPSCLPFHLWHWWRLHTGRILEWTQKKTSCGFLIAFLFCGQELIKVFFKSHSEVCNRKVTSTVTTTWGFSPLYVNYRRMNQLWRHLLIKSWMLIPTKIKFFVRYVSDFTFVISINMWLTSRGLGGQRGLVRLVCLGDNSLRHRGRSTQHMYVFAYLMYSGYSTTFLYWSLIKYYNC